MGKLFNFGQSGDRRKDRRDGGGDGNSESELPPSRASRRQRQRRGWDKSVPPEPKMPRRVFPSVSKSGGRTGDSKSGGGNGSSIGGTTEAILKLPHYEVGALQVCVRMLSEDFTDPDNLRLYPKGHISDEAVQDEFFELTHQELTASRLKSLDTLKEILSGLAAGGGQQQLSLPQFERWVGAVNVLYLAVGARLEAKGFSFKQLGNLGEQFSEESDRFELAAFFMMFDMLEEASDFLTSQLVLESVESDSTGGEQ